jgi:hypothetical protein
MNSRTLSKEFTVTLSSGKVVTAEVEATLVHESNYGADVDGNRGISADFVEDIYLTTPIDDPLWECDDNDRPLTEDEKEEAERLILEMAEKDDWEYDSSDYDDCYGF